MDYRTRHLVIYTDTINKIVATQHGASYGHRHLNAASIDHLGNKNFMCVEYPHRINGPACITWPSKWNFYSVYGMSIPHPNLNT